LSKSYWKNCGRRFESRNCTDLQNNGWSRTFDLRFQMYD